MFQLEGIRCTRAGLGWPDSEAKDQCHWSIECVCKSGRTESCRSKQKPETSGDHMPW